MCRKTQVLYPQGLDTLTCVEPARVRPLIIPLDRHGSALLEMHLIQTGNMDFFMGSHVSISYNGNEVWTAVALNTHTFVA